MFAEGNIFGASANGVPLFLAYLAVAGALLALFMGLYLSVTRHDEIGLIRQENVSAALALAGTLLGFCIPLTKALAQASSIIDFVLWSGIALVIQILAYGVANLMMPGLSGKIQENSVTSAVLVAAISLAFGMLSAAAMTE